MVHRDSFREDYEFAVEKTEEGGYSVYLPHQCDGWEIIGAEDESDEPKDDGYPAYPLDKQLAINQMKLFIKRAEEALIKLEQL